MHNILTMGLPKIRSSFRGASLLNMPGSIHNDVQYFDEVEDLPNVVAHLTSHALYWYCSTVHCILHVVLYMGSGPNIQHKHYSTECSPRLHTEYVWTKKKKKSLNSFLTL
jgi:hypothetical protein